MPRSLIPRSRFCESDGLGNDSLASSEEQPGLSATAGWPTMELVRARCPSDANWLLYRKHEHLSPGYRSIIEISVTSPSPEMASLIANTPDRKYIEHSFRENFSATEKISGWLETKLDGLKANLEES